MIAEEGNKISLMLELVGDVAVSFLLNYLRAVGVAVWENSCLCHTDNKGTSSPTWDER